MDSSIKKFFIFSVLLLLFYNISGLGICIEHSQHSKNHPAKTDGSKKENHKYISQDDNCQCALHFQMNHVLLPDVTSVELSSPQLTTATNPQPKVLTYSCLIDFFSSRAPPAQS
jgi:hypothetical protein